MPSAKSETRPLGTTPPRHVRAPVDVSGEHGCSQHHVLLALEHSEIHDVRRVMMRIPDAKRRAILLAPSKKPEHKLRTPLMVAAATGDLAIFSYVLDAFNKMFRNKTDGKRTIQQRKERRAAMKQQLELADKDGVTLLMLAAASTSVAVFTAVAKEIRPDQFRMLIPRQDVGGMTFLMHAVNPESGAGRAQRETTGTATQRRPTSTAATRERVRLQSADLAPSSPHPAARGLAAQGNNRDDPAQDGGTASSTGAPSVAMSAAHLVDPWVPVVKSVLEFAKKRLWMPEYRCLLMVRDSWNRGIIEHSVISGRHVVFEAVFDAIREDIYDDEIDILMETGEDTDYEQSPMRKALNTVGGREVASLVTGKGRHLKRDVSFRAEASTVSSKIQAFIPGNLIVIFQLVLPEFDKDSQGPLVLLLVLCMAAPLWAWGASLVSTTHPDRKHTMARETPWRYALAFPSMFFWGVGTSTVGTFTFGWAETGTAAALAVATIIIPAMDSFLSGIGARSLWSKVVVGSVNLYERLQNSIPSWLKGREAWLYDDDDDDIWLDETDYEQYPRGVGSTGINTLLQATTTTTGGLPFSFPAAARAQHYYDPEDPPSNDGVDKTAEASYGEGQVPRAIFPAAAAARSPLQRVQQEPKEMVDVLDEKNADDDDDDVDHIL